MTSGNVSGELAFLRDRKLAGSHPESRSHPLARCLAACEVLVGYPGVLIFTLDTLTAASAAGIPIRASSEEAPVTGKPLALEKVTKGNFSIAMKADNSQVVLVVHLTQSSVSSGKLNGGSRASLLCQAPHSIA